MKIKFQNIRFKIYYSTFFKLKIFIVRLLNNKIKLNRTISYPFITGDGFRSLASHIQDDISSINPIKVKEGDIVFVRSDMLHHFFKKINPKINSNFILISHNADNNIDDTFKKYDLKNITHWHAQNNLLSDSRISPLPIGISNMRYKHDIVKILSSSKLNTEKKPRVLSAFSLETNLIRKTAKEFLNKSNVSDNFNGNQEEYFQKLNEYCFIASPEGNGVDCHRTWEGLYFKVVPIVIKNKMTEDFLKEGIPLLLIDKWEDVINFNEDFLKNQYEQLRPLFDSQKIYLNYWFTKILK